MQSFGRYDTAAAAAAAYDVGFILCRGPRGKINFSFAAYLDAGRHFRDELNLPAPVAVAISRHLAQLTAHAPDKLLAARQLAQARFAPGAEAGPHGWFLEAAGLLPLPVTDAGAAA